MNYDLIINGKKICSFKFPIDKYIIYGEKIFVLLDLLSTKEILNENVYCVDFEGYIFWQMEKIKRTIDDSPIVEIILLDSKLKVIDWSGEYFILDINNGKIIDSMRGKGLKLW